jgi:hypothetical protein
MAGNEEKTGTNSNNNRNDKQFRYQFTELDYKKLFETAGDVIAHVDEEGNILSISCRTYRFFSRSIASNECL